MFKPFWGVSISHILSLGSKWFRLCQSVLPNCLDLLMDNYGKSTHSKNLTMNPLRSRMHFAKFFCQNWWVCCFKPPKRWVKYSLKMKVSRGFPMVPIETGMFCSFVSQVVMIASRLNVTAQAWRRLSWCEHWKEYPPWNWHNLTLENWVSQKETIVFQPSIFRSHVSFRKGN